MQPEEPEFLLPFDGMGIGDSFFIPTLKFAEKIYNIDTQAKEAGIRVKIFIVHEKYLGVRTWRIK